jgi:hypothetical protein
VSNSRGTMPLVGSLAERQENGTRGVILGRLCKSNRKVLLYQRRGVPFSPLMRLSSRMR